MEWTDHVWRADKSIVKTVLVNNLNGKRPRGRPKQRWLDVVKRYIQELRPYLHRNLRGVEEFYNIDRKGPKWSIMLFKKTCFLF